MPKDAHLVEGDLIDDDATELVDLEARLLLKLFAQLVAVRGTDVVDAPRVLRVDPHVEQRQQRRPAKGRGRHARVRGDQQLAAVARGKLRTQLMHHRRLPGAAGAYHERDPVALDGVRDALYGLPTSHRRPAQLRHAQKLASTLTLLRVERRVADGESCAHRCLVVRPGGLVAGAVDGRKRIAIRRRHVNVA